MTNRKNTGSQMDSPIDRKFIALYATFASTHNLDHFSHLDQQFLKAYCKQFYLLGFREGLAAVGTAMALEYEITEENKSLEAQL